MHDKLLTNCTGSEDFSHRLLDKIKYQYKITMGALTSAFREAKMNVPFYK